MSDQVVDVYGEFLASKTLVVQAVGKELAEQEWPACFSVLFPFQQAIVQWAVRKGRCAIWADVGLGKTPMQICWAVAVGERTLIVAPLAVTMQTVEMARDLMDVEVRYIRSSAEITDDCQLYITNYEMFEKLDVSLFGAVVLDESSALKDLTGIIRTSLVKEFKNTPYKLCCTATPAPNDITELGNHAEFLGIMTVAQMTSVFFVHEASKLVGDFKTGWRLKGHATREFYRWLSSWGIALKKPSDIGFSDEGYNLPTLNLERLIVPFEFTPVGMLPGIGVGAVSAIEARKIRRESISSRAALAVDMINSSAEQWIVWTGLNDEADTLAAVLDNSINVYGAMKPEAKIDALRRFIRGEIKVLISKASIAGMGMNLQQCRNMLFFGIDFSWESFYQAKGRIYRFKQQHDQVNIYVLISEQETRVLDTVERKGKEAEKMTEELIAASSEFTNEELHGNKAKWQYSEDEATGHNWRLILGDSCKRMKELATGSVHLSVYSPPFSDMYVYNNTPRDLSNSPTIDDFFAHYTFIISDLLRLTMPGRLTVVHIQDLKIMKNREGYRGLRDFSGMVIEAYQKAGWIFRSRITIDKNPQVVATRNKDTDLLFVTGVRDSADLAPMATDYLLLFKAPGENPIPITPYKNGEMSREDWISWAHAVWYGIRETDTLNARIARADGDDKHICPIQLPVVDRAIRLWSNPGETVFSPFAGIGSEPYQAVKRGRFGLGIELKKEYWLSAIDNVREAERVANSVDMFGFSGVKVE